MVEGKRIAIIINGDAEVRHLENVSRSLAALQKQGFSTYVASPTNPGLPADRYTQATTGSVRKLLDDLRLKGGPDDELVIYTTGHGDYVDGEAVLRLPDDHQKKNDIISRLDKIPYKNRTVVMDQCYSGNVRLFTNNPRTLFVSAGSKGETTCCQEVAPRFWSNDVPDANRDGDVSWGERYAFMVSQKVTQSDPHFIPTPGFKDVGTPAFTPNVTSVDDGPQLSAQLKRLQPGQYAIILFSADWCGPCKLYKPQFVSFAKEAGGQHLFLTTENDELAKSQFGITEFPAVMIITADGKRHKVQDKNNILTELGAASQNPTQRIIEKIEVLNQKCVLTFGSGDCVDAIGKLAKTMSSAELGEKIAPLFDRLIEVAAGQAVYCDRAKSLGDIALALGKSGLGEKVGMLFDKLEAAIHKIPEKDVGVRDHIAIASGLAQAGLKDRAAVRFNGIISRIYAEQGVPGHTRRLEQLLQTGFAAYGAGLRELGTGIIKKAISDIQHLDTKYKDSHLSETLRLLGLFSFTHGKEAALPFFEHTFITVSNDPSIPSRTHYLKQTAEWLSKLGDKAK